jgi:flagellar motor switch/type III secretory pathway protein FliN
MLEQVSNSVKFLAFYTASKQGKTGLADIYDPSGTQIVTGGSATALGGGLYSYTLTSNNSSEGEYAAIFKTTDSTVDSQHIPSLWVLGRAGVENLDASTSSRLPSSSYAAAPSVSDIRTELSVELGRIDATISSRSTLTTGDLPSVPSAASVASAVRTELTELSNLDASVSSRLASVDYTAPTSAPTAAAVASAVRSELTELSNLDASVSSRLASADYTTPPTTAQISAAVEGSLLDENDGQAVLNAIVGAIGNQNVDEIALVAAIRSDLERTGGKLDSIPTDAAPSAASVASAVWSASTKEITGGTVTTLTNAPDVPTEAEIAAQVRTELSVELGRIDQSISTRLAASAYTAPSTPPTAAAIADEVRVELATELANLDAPVSGATAPSAATVATAVRTELATELARVDAAVSTRLAGSAYTAPANSDVAAIKAKTDALNTERLANVATTAIVGNLLAQANS